MSCSFPPYINRHIHMFPPSWTSLPSPALSHPSSLSQSLMHMFLMEKVRAPGGWLACPQSPFPLLLLEWESVSWPPLLSFSWHVWCTEADALEKQYVNIWQIVWALLVPKVSKTHSPCVNFLTKQLWKCSHSIEFISLGRKKECSICCIPDNLKKQNWEPNVLWGGRQPVVISFLVKARCLLYCCIPQEAAGNRSWTRAWGGRETFEHKLHKRELGSILNVFLALHVSFWVWFTLVITSLSILSLERKGWMETALETSMPANNAGDPIQDCAPQALLSFTPSAPLVISGSSGDWGHNFAKHISFLYGRKRSRGQWILCCSSPPEWRVSAQPICGVSQW